MAQVQTDVKDAATKPGETNNDKPLAERRLDAGYWSDTIRERERTLEEWNDKVDNILKRVYSMTHLASNTRKREMQIAWANFEVVKPAIYVNPPSPVVVSRYKDRKPLTRHGSEILERAITTTFDHEGVHETLLQVRDDMVDCSRGVAWCRLDENESGQPKVSVDHVDRRDFMHSPSRNWKEVWWVSRKIYLDEEECERRFGEVSGDLWRQLEFSKQAEDLDDEQKSGDEQAEVYEIWCKLTGLVYWCHPDLEKFLHVSDPPINVKGFFPCPRPAFGTTEATNLVPVPHYVYIKDQLEEINELTDRITAMSENLRLKGFYQAGAEDLSEALERIITNTDNRSLMVPVPSTTLMSGQTLEKSIVWMPLSEIAQAISGAVALRKQLLEDVYEITGISDIMRGQSAASESATAQQLKSQYGSIRIKKMQGEMVRIAADLAALVGEIIAETFPLDHLRLMTQYDEVQTAQERQMAIQRLQNEIIKAQQNPELMKAAQENPEAAQQIVAQVQEQISKLMQQPTWEQVVQMLQEERLRPYMIDIETDSTIMPDENAQKQRVSEFLTALGGALQQLSAMVGARPDTAEFAGEVLKFAVTPFRAGRQLDTAIDNMIEKIQQPAQQGPSPEEIKAQADMQKAQVDADAKMQIEQFKIQAEERMTSMKAEADARQKATIEEVKARADKELAVIKAKFDANLAEYKHQHEMHQLEFDAREHADKMKLEWAKLGLEYEQAEQDENGEMVAKPSSIEKALTSIAETQTALAKSLRAKKRLVRDEQGNAIGVEVEDDDDAEASV